MTNTLILSETWMIQDPLNVLLFSFEINEDPSLIGEYTLAFALSLDNNPADILYKEILSYASL